MRCLLISPGYRNKFESFYYSFDKRFINGLIRNNCHVIHISDRDIADSVIGIRSIGKIYANIKIRQIARHSKPNLVILFHADILTNKTLSDIKNDNDCKIINIDCDAIASQKRFDRLVKRHPIVDYSFVTTAGERLERLRSTGLATWFIPNPADVTIDREVDLGSKKDYDIIYVASSSENSLRWNLIKSIEAKAPDLKVGKFGSRKRVRGHEYYDLLNKTRFALNWSFENDVKYYSSDRIAQLFGAGVAVCIPRSTGYGDFLSDDEAILFGDEDELIQKIRALKETGRWVEIAKAGRQKYLRLFSETEVCRYMLSVVKNENLEQFERFLAK